MENQMELLTSSTGLEEIQISEDEKNLNGYVVMLINSTDYVVKQVSINNSPFVPTMNIGRTCSSTDYHNCASNGKYAPLTTVNCGGLIQVTVRLVGPDGKWYRTSWDPFNANCGQRGGIIQLV